MKKRNILIFSIMTVCTLLLCSYREGPATYSGWDCTGAETGLSNPAGCSSGSCHGNTATSGITVALEIDSSPGMPVTQYKGGLNYTVKITGTNTTANNLPKFGFQVASILGSAAQVTPTNAGTFQQSGLPSGVQFSAPQSGNFVTNIIEHSMALNPASGTGGNGTIYSKSFGWTAPVTGTGTVSFWAALNAVNGDGNASSADKWNITHLVLEEDTSKPVSSIMGPDLNVNINVYPNPVTDIMQVNLHNGALGVYTMSAYAADGRRILQREFEVSNDLAETAINTVNWPVGIYMVQLCKDGQEKVVKVVKR